MKLLRFQQSLLNTDSGLPTRADLLFACLFSIPLLFYAYLLISFVAHDGLSSLATDSANYMVMARYLSPWHESSAAIDAAWPQQDYPVLFPLILALAGTAYDFFLAHTLTALFLVVSLPLLYLYARSLEISRATACMAVIIVALSPAAWINSLGILSENMYLMLSLLTLLMHKKMQAPGTVKLFLFGFLLAALVLTRTVGISMLVAYLLVSVINMYVNKQKDLRLLSPVLIGLIIIAATQLIHNTTIPAQYTDQLSGLLLDDKEMETSYNFLLQLKSVSDAWFTSWLYYWNKQLTGPFVITGILGLLAVAGMLLRLKKNKLDAMYLALYLFIILIWPHPGQAARFIYPVLFILVSFAIYAVYVFMHRLTPGKTQLIANIVLVVFLASVVPAMSYTWHRHNDGKAFNFQYYKEYYSIPDINEARKNTEIQSIMYSDFDRIISATPQGSKIMFVIPAYIALLTDRVAEEVRFYRDKSGAIRLNRENDYDYVYLSRLHPRKTREDINGLYIYTYFRDWTELLWVSKSELSKEPVSYFLKVNK